MKKTTSLIDVPDAVLLSEVQRRRAAMRKTFGAGPGRPKVMKTCEACGTVLSSRDFRKHQCTGTGRINQ
jgi:hypothetical protein